jgi:hypothetical protein
MVPKSTEKEDLAYPTLRRVPVLPGQVSAWTGATRGAVTATLMPNRSML